MATPLSQLMSYFSGCTADILTKWQNILNSTYSYCPNGTIPNIIVNGGNPQPFDIQSCNINLQVDFPTPTYPTLGQLVVNVDGQSPQLFNPSNPSTQTITVNFPSIQLPNDGKLFVTASNSAMTPPSNQQLTSMNNAADAYLTLHNVAFTGDYNSLSNKPIGSVMGATQNGQEVAAPNNMLMILAPDWNAGPGNQQQILNKPTFPTKLTDLINQDFVRDPLDTTSDPDSCVVVDCNYHHTDVNFTQDLYNKVMTSVAVGNGMLRLLRTTSVTDPLPQLPGFSANSQTDVIWDLGLSEVALTGSFNDLTDIPNIETVNDGILSLTLNNFPIGYFSANTASNVDVNINAITEITSVTQDNITFSSVETDGQCDLILDLKDITVTPTTSSITVPPGGTFTCISSLNVDSKGRLIGYNVQTVTVT